MIPLPIIYYGRPGLETQVFQSYMMSSGYRVQVVYSRDSASCALDANPDAIVVIAAEQDPQELIRQAETFQAQVKLEGHVFLISPAESLDLQLAGIDVIPRPFRLSELVKRIRALSPDSKPN